MHRRSFFSDFLSFFSYNKLTKGNQEVFDSHHLISILHITFTSVPKELFLEILKGAQSRYFELFWPHTKLPLNGRKPENNSFINKIEKHQRHNDKPQSNKDG